MHGSLEKSLSEPCHIMNRAVDEELPDEILVRESLNKPEAQANIFLECFSNESYILRKNRSVFGSKPNSQEEGDHKLECFELAICLILLAKALQIERGR